MAKPEPISLNLREAMWEADQRIAELGRQMAKGDEEAVKTLLCMAGLGCCKRTVRGRR